VLSRFTFLAPSEGEFIAKGKALMLGKKSYQLAVVRLLKRKNLYWLGTGGWRLGKRLKI
jgi:hypothetical protein